MWLQREITLSPQQRGFHLITHIIEQKVPELRHINIGVMTLFIKHTSASLTLNENADDLVRSDMEKFFNHLVPEDTPYFDHTYEGSDDMPAHIKSTVIGASQTLPITQGHLNLGTWQGIYLCEHRNHGGRRTIVVTINGE